MPSPIAVTVEFASDGSCTVVSDAARSVQPSGSKTSNFRCSLPSRELAGRSVLLRVVVPPGSGPATGSFPQLGWYREGERVIGTATLPSSPAFVSLRPGDPPDATAAFGWNFYGFFVFSAAFIAAYFAWSFWMRVRDRQRPVAR